jgi:putative hydrolase of the HAD superfamily
MHKTIIFDLGKVLIHFDFKRGYQALEGSCKYAAAEIPERLSQTGLVERFETGLVEPREFVEQFSRILDLRMDYDRFCEIWSCIFTHTLIPESMLEALAAKYRLLLLSNTNALHFAMLRQTYSHLLRHFHSLILSYEVRAMKPQPEIYRAAIEQAECLPGECFYTDDILAYVEAAQNLGIDAVQFESRDQIEKAMRDRGIAW